MWPWRFSLAIFAASAAMAAETSVGPSYDAEAQILWKDGRALYESGKYGEAIIPLQRLHDRYPGFPDAQAYREELLWLGRSYLEERQPEKAIEDLRAYLEGEGKRNEPLQAKVWLGEAYLRSRRFHEAELMSRELEKSEGPEVRSQAFLLRARALIGLNQDDRAELALSSAEKLAEELRYPNLMGQATSLRFQLKTRQCEKATAPAQGKPQEEGRVIREITERGLCLNESLPLYRKNLDIQHKASSERSQVLLAKAYTSYWSACTRPPAPPGSRTSTQRKQYRLELADRLQAICRKQIEISRGILKNWTLESPRLPDFELQKVLETDRELAKYSGGGKQSPAEPPRKSEKERASS